MRLKAMLVVICGAWFMLGHAIQAPQPGPLMSGGTRGDLRMLLDTQQLGSSEVTVGERTYPANYASAEHTHAGIEVIYVLSGEFHHEINGQTHVLGPGTLGFVKPGDTVRHKTGPAAPVKALVVWVPGEEGMRIAEGFRDQP